MEGRELFHRKLETGVSRKPEFGGLRMDLRNQTIENTQTGKRVRLTKSEYQILWTLVRAQGNIINEEELSNFLYEEHPDEKDLPLSNTLKVFMVKVRNKLQEVAGDKIQIVNEQGLGYKLELESPNEGA